MTDERNGEVPAREDRVRDHSLDEVAKGLASGGLSRRDALKWAGAAIVGGLLSAIPGVALAEPKPPGQQGGKPPGQQGGKPPGQQGGKPPGQGGGGGGGEPVACTGTCAHDPCEIGGPLTPGCDLPPPGMTSTVTLICAADPFCCGEAWDAICAEEYAQRVPTCCPAGAATTAQQGRLR